MSRWRGVMVCFLQCICTMSVQYLYQICTIFLQKGFGAERMSRRRGVMVCFLHGQPGVFGLRQVLSWYQTQPDTQGCWVVASYKNTTDHVSLWVNSKPSSKTAGIGSGTETPQVRPSLEVVLVCNPTKWRSRKVQLQLVKWRRNDGRLSASNLYCAQCSAVELWLGG